MTLPATLTELVKRQQSPLCGRRRIIPIHFDTLTQILKGEVKIIEGMPADADIIAVNQTSLFATAELVVESESFERLMPGEVIPIVSLLLQRIVSPNAKEKEQI